MTASPADASTPPAHQRPLFPARLHIVLRSARSGARRYARSLGVILVLLVLLTIALLVASRISLAPIVQFDAETSIVTIEPAGKDLIWNLPDMDLRTITYDTGTPIEALRKPRPGIGALIAPPGSVLTVVRTAGGPLSIRIVNPSTDMEGAPPQRARLITASADAAGEGIVLETGATILTPPSEPPPGAGTANRADNESCPHDLPPLTVRGTAFLTVGSNIPESQFDDPETLAGISPQDYADHLVQPILKSGTLLVFGRTLFGDSYRASEQDLQFGDYLDQHRAGKEEAPSAAVKPDPASRDTADKDAARFILSVAGCESLRVRGRARSEKLWVNRLGSDPERLRLLWWQPIRDDPLLSALIVILGAVMAILQACLTVSDLWDRRKIIGLATDADP